MKNLVLGTLVLSALSVSVAGADPVSVPVHTLQQNAYNEGFDGARLVVRKDAAVVRLDLWKTGYTRDPLDRPFPGSPTYGITFYPVDVVVDGLVYSKEQKEIKFVHRDGREAVCAKVKGKSIFREYVLTGNCALDAKIATREVGEGWDRQQVRDIDVSLVVDLK